VLESPHAEANLRRMWKEDGIHPAEAVHDAQRDAFLKHEITAKQVEVKIDPADLEVLTETGGKPGSLGAAATEPGDVPLDVQPAQPPGSLPRRSRPPPTRCSTSAATRRCWSRRWRAAPPRAWRWRRTLPTRCAATAGTGTRIDTDIAKRFTPEQRARMWNAMDEESLSLQLGEPARARAPGPCHAGRRRSAPRSRNHTRRSNAWLRARDLGMVEGEGIPMHARAW
jgi:hypothetical protein